MGIFSERVSPEAFGGEREGEYIEIEGVTTAQFSPMVLAQKIHHLGLGTFPEPIRPTWDQLINGSLDTQFVEIQGVVTSVRADGVTLLTHGGKINVLIFGTNSSTNEAGLKRYEDALIRLRGCLFASWDEATHNVNVSEIRMITPSVTVEEPAPMDACAVCATAAGR